MQSYEEGHTTNGKAVHTKVRTVQHRLAHSSKAGVKIFQTADGVNRSNSSEPKADRHEEHRPSTTKSTIQISLKPTHPQRYKLQRYILVGNANDPGEFTLPPKRIPRSLLSRSPRSIDARGLLCIRRNANAPPSRTTDLSFDFASGGDASPTMSPPLRPLPSPTAPLDAPPFALNSGRGVTFVAVREIRPDTAIGCASLCCRAQ